MRLSYRSGYDHVTADVFQVETGIFGYEITLGKFLSLNTLGLLTISSEYAWDGATWALDTPSFMRGSLTHDACYQMIREGVLPQSYRKRADELLIELCREDGMFAIRRLWVWAAVRKFGGFAVRSSKPVLYAPTE